MTRPKHFVPRSVGEVILAIKNAKTKKERVEILKDNDSVTLQSILRMQFDPNIKFLFDSDELNLKVSNFPIGLGECNLKSESKRFYLFLKHDNYKVQSVEKVKQIFKNMVSGLDPIEGQVLIDVSKKKLKCGLSKKAIEEVYPGLLGKEAK